MYTVMYVMGRCALGCVLGCLCCGHGLLLEATHVCCHLCGEATGTAATLNQFIGVNICPGMKIIV